MLNDCEILDLCTSASLISPHVGYQVGTDIEGKKIISYGVSSFGYDVRLGTVLKGFKPAFTLGANDAWTQAIDPLNFNADLMEEFEVDSGSCAVIPPHGYFLGHTLEYIRMPRHLNALCIGKSTYARAGIFINTTPIESGWEGQITLEIANLTPRPAKIYVGHGICQLQFFEGNPPMVSYADRLGKYQGQLGVTYPKG